MDEPAPTPADPEPTPPPAAPPNPAAPSQPELSPLARERERDRLLTLANVQRARGQLPEAQETLKQALALGDAESKDAAPVHEMLGDLLAADEKWDAAKAAYGKAQELNPARASAERKFAQMTLREADEKAERALAEAMLRGDLPPAAAATRGKRSAGMAMLLSAVAPGFGQLYNGQLVKGLICLGIFFLTLLLIQLSPDGDLLVRQALSLLVGRRVRGATGEASPVLWLLLFLSAAVWIYSLLDAPIVASKTQSREDGGPKVDKSGWEV